MHILDIIYYLLYFCLNMQIWISYMLIYHYDRHRGMRLSMRCLYIIIGFSFISWRGIIIIRSNSRLCFCRFTWIFCLRGLFIFVGVGMQCSSGLGFWTKYKMNDYFWKFRIISYFRKTYIEFNIIRFCIHPCMLFYIFYW